MNVYQLTAREQVIFVFLLIVCFVYGGYALIYRPSLAKRQQLDVEIRLAKKELGGQEKVIQKERRWAEGFSDTIKSMRQNTTNEEAMSTILTEIENAARGTPIRVTEMKPQGALKVGEYNQLTISLTVDGNFLDILAFIHVLQTPPHDLRITRFEFEKLIGEPQKLLAKIAVVRFYIPSVEKENNTAGNQEKSMAQP